MCFRNSKLLIHLYWMQKYINVCVYINVIKVYEVNEMTSKILADDIRTLNSANTSGTKTISLPKEWLDDMGVTEETKHIRLLKMEGRFGKFIALVPVPALKDNGKD